jgi:radical SAM enzyme (TIGR01210 family)
MTEISEFCHDLKAKMKPKKGRLDRPVAFWSEPDRYQDEIIDAFVIILKTKGCSWAHESGCTMCGYFNDSAFTDISDDDLLSQFHNAMESYNNEPVVKIFTSGSFFDPDEIKEKIQTKILKELSKTTKKIAVESRPEYVTNKHIKRCDNDLSENNLEVGIGLESAHDDIRNFNINKGFSFQDYQTAANVLHDHHHLLKTYVLVKPPFLSEKQAIHDAIETIRAIANITDTISLNPTNVQRATLVEYLWKRHYYRPPWLWSINEILKQGSKMTKKRLQCDVVGGGSRRGPHNCKNCDKSVLKNIRKFSLTQDISDLNFSECECKQQWHDQIHLEPLSFGSFIDIQRGLIS